ncbi:MULTISPECIES: glycosyltransferase [Caproicibacterium]|uniref:Glycosyltransferase n=1 Tax=Caproicibacterium argilliputei TaxID=3030016 RepID=A0AA97D9B6_9FIRM|nr:glycosyltransferase [Caproicibacterium argilliputei]WOC31435.1 glycosyltransferase [Caproicibacterium argilliputei]
MKVALFSGAGAVKCAASTYTSVLKSGLEKAGHQVLLVTADPAIDDCFAQDGKIFCPAKITPSLYGMSVRTSLLGPMEELLNNFRPDLVHLVTLDEMGLAGLKYAQRRRLPLVTTIHNLHDALEGYGVNKAYDNLAKMKVRSTVRKIVTESDMVLAPSAQTAGLLQELDISCAVARSPFCIDLETFHPSEPTSQIRERLNIPKDVTCYIFAGRLVDDCGLDELLEVWNASVPAIDNLHLIVAGSGPDAAFFAEKVKMLSLSYQVTFAGELSPSDLNDCFSCCRAFVSASRSSAVKASPLEAQAAGLPVIVHKDSANAELVRDGVNGFTYDTPSQFGEKLHMMAGLDPEGEILLRKLVRKSAVNLSDKNLAAVMEDTYEEAKKHHRETLRDE